MVLRLDELNILRSRPFDEYFSVMDLTDEQMARRMKFADQFETFMLTVFYTISIMLDNGSVNWDYIDGMVREGYADILGDFMEPDSYTDGMIDQFTKDFRRSTETVTAPVTDITPLAIAWLLSMDRARYDAENEANSALNYGEYRDAVQNGYTTKIWHTEADDRVRDTHILLESMEKPIYEYFKVGDRGAYMRFPKDIDLAAGFPEEYVNCRCTISYR